MGCPDRIDGHVHGWVCGQEVTQWRLPATVTHPSSIVTSRQVSHVRRKSTHVVEVRVEPDPAPASGQELDLQQRQHQRQRWQQAPAGTVPQ